MLHVTQNRWREKSFLRNNGIPVTPFWHVQSLEELQAAVLEAGLPAVLKTADWGYDGKGQAKLTDKSDLAEVWKAFAGADAILEAFVDFACEISVVGARGLDGKFVAYSPMHNTHSRHILDISVSPSPQVSLALSSEVTEITRMIFEKLDVVGVLCVEFFVGRDGRPMVNELAPRPHNSGHLTIDANVSCQFEQQVRAVCGLPLGSVRQHAPAAMVNLLGDLWHTGEPDWARALSNSDAKLHLYGKSEARPGRKMGHLTVLADTPEEAVARAVAARGSLVR